MSENKWEGQEKGGERENVPPRELCPTRMKASLPLSPIQPMPPLVTSNVVALETAPHVADGEMVGWGVVLMPWIGHP